MKHLIFVTPEQAAIIGAGLMELPGKHCNPVVQDINAQTELAAKDPAKFVALVEAFLAPIKASLAVVPTV